MCSERSTDHENVQCLEVYSSQEGYMHILEYSTTLQQRNCAGRLGTFHFRMGLLADRLLNFGWPPAARLVELSRMSGFEEIGSLRCVFYTFVQCRHSSTLKA